MIYTLDSFTISHLEPVQFDYETEFGEIWVGILSFTSEVTPGCLCISLKGSLNGWLK